MGGRAGSRRRAASPPRWRTRPSWATSRAGSPSRSSQAHAWAPRTSAAVVAMFASAQLAAATLTVRHVERAGEPVRGSMMWCIVRPSWRQRRTVVLEVASPPPQIEIVCPGASGPLRWSSVTCTRQPPAGAAPQVAMSPPTLTSAAQAPARAAACAARSAAHALAVAPRSRRMPAGTRTVPLAASTRTVRHPLRARTASAFAAGAAGSRSPVRAFARGSMGARSRAGCS